MSRLRQRVLPRLTAKGESLLQKRMEGTTLTESEREELVRLYGWAVGLAPKDHRMQARYNYVLGYGELRRAVAKLALAGWAEGVDVAHDVVGEWGWHGG